MCTPLYPRFGAVSHLLGLGILAALLAACGATTPEVDTATYAPGRGHLTVTLENLPTSAAPVLSIHDVRCAGVPRTPGAPQQQTLTRADFDAHEGLESLGVSLSVTLKNLRPGCYTVTAERVKDDSGRFYNAAIEGTPFRIRPRTTASATVAYRLEPFTVRDGQIYDPAGEPFVIRGANVQGRNFGWEDTDTIRYADNIIDEWKFNFVRVNENVKGTPFCTRENPASWCKPYWGWATTPEELEPLIDTFTSRGVVVMLEAHDWSGRYPDDEDLAKLVAWHRSFADYYQDNPYVWLNVYNEPGNLCAPVRERWLEVHDAVVAAIRATGNQNIVVAGGSNFGIERDCGTNPDGSFSYRPKGPVPDEYSAILTYGPELARRYDNVAFSIHTWCIWTPTGDASFDYETDSEQAMNDYFDRVAARKLAIFVGEFGSNGGGNCDGLPAVRTTYNVTRPRGIGRVVWHWWAGDNNKLVHQDQGFRINSPTDPTNLTPLGKLVWDDTHDFDGTGSVYVDEGAQPPEGALERSGWTASATPGLPTTNRFTGENIEAPNMLDGDASTYWATGQVPDTGMYVQVDLGTPQSFTAVHTTLASNPGDFADGLDVLVSDGGESWQTVASDVPGSRGEPFVATFDPQSARYVRLVWSAPQGQAKWWTIAEFFLTDN